MKFKLVYIYPAFVIIIIAVLLLTITDDKKSPNMVDTSIANKEMPKDEIHTGLNVPNNDTPNKGNVNSSVLERLAILKNEVDRFPNDTLRLREYADFLTAAHRPDEAIEYYGKILKLYPKKIDILFNLSFIYNNKRDFEKAENFTNKILQIAPNNSQAWYNLGAIKASSGNRNKAKEIWERLIKDYPVSHSAELAKLALEKL